MILNTAFTYQPADYEDEKASNSYLMSLIAIMIGLPLPIINLIATFGFYFMNRKESIYIRWHCTQALLSQITLFLTNTVVFWWTFSIFFGVKEVTDLYIGYLSAVIVFNIIEFVVTIYTSIQIRKGKHLEWWFYGGLTNKLFGI